MRDFLKKSSHIKFIIKSLRTLQNKTGFFKKVYLLTNYFSDLFKFRKIKANDKFKFEIGDVYPCIFDKTSITPIGSVYFYQDTWCAKKIFETKPKHHYDVGSMAELIGIISQFTPTTMIDIRPIGLELQGLNFIKGDIKKLPFKDGAIDSLSAICVIEHIGLGRYGDEMDSYGSEKAVRELVRILAKNGNLFISVPIDSENKIYFNAHRAFSRKYIMELFKELEIMEERYIYSDNLENNYSPSKGFGTGLFHFKKQ